MSPVTQSTYIFRQFIKPLKKILTLVMVVPLVHHMFSTCKRSGMEMMNADDLILIRLLRSSED